MEASHILEKIEPLLTEQRKARIDAVLNYRLNSLHLALESPSDINNALATIRTAEALGIDTVHIIKAEGSARTAHGMTIGAVYWVNVLYHASLSAFLNWLQAQDQKFKLAGAKMDGEYTLNSVPISDPICILLGNEHRGLSPEAEKACDLSFHIPMCGMSESLNLSVSAAISLYDLTQRKRQSLRLNSDLNPAQVLERKAHFYEQSIPPRVLKNLLKQP